jgi:hypothetical protein
VYALVVWLVLRKEIGIAVTPHNAWLMTGMTSAAAAVVWLQSGQPSRGHAAAAAFICGGAAVGCAELLRREFRDARAAKGSAGSRPRRP